MNRDRQQRLPIVASFILFLLLSACIAYWVMQLFKPPPRMVAAPPQASAPEPNLDAAANLFGGRRAPAEVATNYQLKGVVNAGNDKSSVAIVSAEGKPGMAVRLGREIAPGVTVKEVHPRYVLLQDNGVIKRIELPDTAPPSGSISAPMAGAPAMPQVPQFSPPPTPAPAPAPAVTPPPPTPPQAAQPAPTPAAPQASIPQPPPAPTEPPGGTLQSVGPGAAGAAAAGGGVTAPVPPNTQTPPSAPPRVIYNAKP